jgi:hypothetical protein
MEISQVRRRAIGAKSSLPSFFPETSLVPSFIFVHFLPSPHPALLLLSRTTATNLGVRKEGGEEGN